MIGFGLGRRVVSVPVPNGLNLGDFCAGITEILPVFKKWLQTEKQKESRFINIDLESNIVLKIYT